MLAPLIFGFLTKIAPETVTFQGTTGPGKGKSIVFLTGDEEYRSEEGLTQLAKILAFRQGFKCTVVYSIAPDGTIDPNTQDNEPGIEALDSADLCVMLLRFRHWPDSQMRHFVNYFLAGKPIVALRTSTHAFDYPADSQSEFRQFGWKDVAWPGGFGKQVLGESWVSHWGDHGHQATRGVPNLRIDSAILKGVQDVFGTTDVYEAAPPPDAKVVLYGQVLTGLSPSDPPATNRKKTSGGIEQPVNDPMMPVAWTREPKDPSGRQNRVFVTTMGAATDLVNEGLRRMLVNACFWAIGNEKSISRHLDVRLVGVYRPSPFAFNGFKKGIKPSDLASRE